MYILANQINWQLFEDSFRKHYREDFGRPAKPIRLMVALILLKHIRNVRLQYLYGFDSNTLKPQKKDGIHTEMCPHDRIAIGFLIDKLFLFRD
ncbi:MAG: hypothetical protein Q7U83_10835 [Daejeonella sp.]|nr:hypothetical protein [Daejeonella sp.]